jgi:5-methyltetrahydropteroyltriglutamate--homocysteine methyltransferase
MIRTYDVGSIPFFGDFGRFTNGSKLQALSDLLHPAQYIADRKYFEDEIITGFIDKIKSGLSVPNYPQFRDMTTMFLNRMNGITKNQGGYRITDEISIHEEQLIIPEIRVIRNKSRAISEKIGDTFKLKICVSGPYTLASFFDTDARSLFIDLGRIISKIISRNIFREKFGEVVLVAVDEPLFSLIDDPILDHGQEGRENLLKAWELIFSEVKSRNTQSIIHLHNTANDLFWHVPSVDIIESHVNDPLYSSSDTNTRLEQLDKFLKASVCTTDFDLLIRHTLELQGATPETLMGQQIANTWKDIKNGRIDPVSFLESPSIITNRLKKTVNKYGHRVCYAGPECGLQSFPTYESAFECLRRVATVSQSFDN